MTLELRPIDQTNVDQLWDIIYANPIRHCYLASKLELYARDGFRNRGADIIGAFHGNQLESALLFGANLVPVELTPASIELFAETLIRQGRRCSSIVGARDEALELWNRIEHDWSPAREIRTSQLVFATSNRSIPSPDELVRYSTLSDLDVLFPACVDMFTEEVGISPTSVDGGYSYRARINELITSKRSFIRVDSGQVVFKTEVGCVGASVAQLQGVWVSPDHRGAGVGGHALSSVVKFVLDDIAPIVSLYVNDYNTSAIALYEKVGFKQVDQFATILF